MIAPGVPAYPSLFSPSLKKIAIVFGREVLTSKLKQVLNIIDIHDAKVTSRRP